MSLELIIALVFTMPVIAFITGFVWYINLGGVWSTLKKGRRSRHNRLGTEEA
jgi:hypothetical protein